MQKLAIIMVILVILIHGLSLTLHVYGFFSNAFAFVGLYQLKRFHQLQLKILKSSKGKAIYFITNKDMRGFLARYMFLKSSAFVSNK